MVFFIIIISLLILQLKYIKTPTEIKLFNDKFNISLLAGFFDGAVVMSSANGLVGTGFASRYRLEPRWVGVRPLHPLLSL